MRLTTILLLAAAFTLSAQDSSAPLTLLKETSKGFSAVAKKAIPAVVFIEAEVEPKANLLDNPFEMFQDDFFNRFFGMPQGPQPRARRPQIAQGTGFFISADGYVLTNNHIVANAVKVTVILNNDKKLVAKVVGTDPKTDLAVLKVETTDAAFLTLGDSDALEVGEWVIAIGNPFGLDASVTVGVVSAKGRNHLNITDFEDFIQTDAAINPGNSGGPLLDVDGNAIGINTAIVTGSGGYMGIGFAVPSNMAKYVTQQLMKTGSVARGYMGVVLQPLDEDLAQSFGVQQTQGALAAEVTKGGPADIGGLRQGDVILSYNGIAVDSIVSLRNAISMLDPGTTVNFSIFRDGQTMNLSIVIGAWPNEPGSNGTAYAKLGFDVEELTPDLAKKLHLQEVSGVVITAVVPGSLADIALIRPGTLVLSVDRIKVNSMADFDKAMQQALQNKRVLLLVKQGNAMRFVTLKFE